MKCSYFVLSLMSMFGFQQMTFAATDVKVEVSLACDPSSTGASQTLVFEYSYPSLDDDGCPNWVFPGNVVLVTQENGNQPISSKPTLGCIGSGGASWCDNKEGLQFELVWIDSKIDSQGVCKAIFSGNFHRAEWEPLSVTHCK